MNDARRETVRRGFEDWNAGSRSVPEWTHPEVVIISAMTGSEYRGHEGVLQWMAEIDEQFSSWQLRADEIEDIDEDRILILGVVLLRGRQSGIELEQPFSWLMRFEDDLGVELRIWPSHEDGRRAAEAPGP